MNVRLAAVTAAISLFGCAAETPAIRVSDRAVVFKDAARLAFETDQLLTTADQAIKAADLAKAKSALDGANAKLSERNIALSGRQQDLAQRASELSARLASARAEAARTPAVVAVADGPSSAERELEDTLVEVTQARANLHGREFSRDEVESAQKARDALSAAIENAPDSSRAGEARKLLAEANEDLRLSSLISAFVEGPGAAQRKGLDLSAQAKDESDAGKRRAQLQEARDAFSNCEQDSRKMMLKAPVLERTALFLSSTRTSPRKVYSACAREAKALGKKLGKSLASR